MKIYKIASLILVLFLILGTACNADSTMSWYLVKHGNAAPDFPKNADFISAHNGFYLDKKSYQNGDKVIYLTFDAGYENGNICKILDIMRSENITGAFFILSNLVRKNPELVRRMKNEGHLVGNHTSDHSDVTKVSTNEMLNNLSLLEEQYKSCTGGDMEKIFRFPEGKYSEKALVALENAGYKTFFWSMAYDDWDNSHQPQKDIAIKKLLGTTHSGAIILLHPTSATNAEILPYLIKVWKEQGYRFGSLSELYK